MALIPLATCPTMVPTLLVCNGFWGRISHLGAWAPSITIFISVFILVNIYY